MMISIGSSLSIPAGAADAGEAGIGGALPSESGLLARQ
jgi:hypothetical protein